MLATILSLAQRKRVFLSRVLIGLILPILLFTHLSWPQRTLAYSVTKEIGFFLIIVGAFGRMWAALYIAGRKGKHLVTTGPYSISRNPLYFFSLVMGLGVIASFENLLLLVPFILFYLSSYFFTILAEERDLAQHFGPEYDNYRSDVPRFFPAFRRYRRRPDAEGWLTISEPRVLKHLFESALFAMLIPLAEILEDLHVHGVLPLIGRS